jgi:hypothetical protein
MPDIPGLADAKPMTHIQALDLQYLPVHVIVLGAGYVGLELAQALRRFGSQVTIIERGSQDRAVTPPTASTNELLNGSPAHRSTGTAFAAQIFRMGNCLLAAGRKADRICFRPI